MTISLIIIALLCSAVASLWALRPFSFLNWFSQLSLGLMLLTCVALGYLGFGGWRECRTYAQQLHEQEKAKALLATIKSPETVIRRMQSHLAEHPQSTKGWYLLGRLYASQHRWLEAKLAFSKAYQLKPNDEQISINFAQSLLALGQEKDAIQARTVLQHVLNEKPGQPDALLLLAMDAYAQKSYQQAIDYWQRLLLLLPPDSEEAAAIRRAIAEANEKLK